MKHLHYKTITTIAEAQKAWESLSPNQVIYDDWRFRFAYYKHFTYPLYFYAAYDEDELVGLLPLMLIPETGTLDFFAGFSYMEDNTVFVKNGYEHIRPELFSRIHLPAKLEYMRSELSTIPNTNVHDYNYYIPLERLTTYDQFLRRHLTSKRRNNIERQMRKLDSDGITFEQGSIEDLPILEEWNRIRFKERSSFAERPYWQAFFQELTGLFDMAIIRAKKESQIVGVGYVLFYNTTCYGINSGYNPEISNLGKYLTLAKIQTAINKGVLIYDAGGSGAFGWKEDFHLPHRPFYAWSNTQ